MIKEYSYASIFASHIEKFICSKRSAGFSYNNPAYWLHHFDRFCCNNEVAEEGISKLLFDTYAAAFPNESNTTKNNRLSSVRTFSVYLNSVGIQSYIPRVLPKPEKNVPYLMEDPDIEEFFQQVDAYSYKYANESFDRLAVEYKVIFRLIYCCGLRNSEACNLKFSDVDVDNGVVTIIHSKGNKDRLVYLSEDLKCMCREYKLWLISKLGTSPEWFFPGDKIENAIPKTSLDRKFNQFWNATAISKTCDKKPTVHSLRHAFVIKRINSWMEDDLSLETMMPYLSRYLGHSSPIDSYYYYHQVKEAFATIKRKDSISGIVIPEVQDVQE